MNTLDVDWTNLSQVSELVAQANRGHVIYKKEGEKRYHIALPDQPDLYRGTEVVAIQVPVKETHTVSMRANMETPQTFEEMRSRALTLRDEIKERRSQFLVLVTSMRKSVNTTLVTINELMSDVNTLDASTKKLFQIPGSLFPIDKNAPDSTPPPPRSSKRRRAKRKKKQAELSPKAGANPHGIPRNSRAVPNGKFKCRVCPLRFRTKQGRGIHTTRLHVNGKK